MKPRAKSARRESRIGDFVIRDSYDGKCGAIVCRKTGEHWDDYERVSYCETDDGAQRLMALMDEAKDLAQVWYRLSSIAPPNGDPKAWALYKIIAAVANAIGAPAPEFPSAKPQGEAA